MAKVLGYIVIEEKGDAEHTKAISTPGIITNKAEYEMEPQKKEQTGIGIDTREKTDEEYMKVIRQETDNFFKDVFED